MAEILQDEFMTMGYLPPKLPVSCLTMAPRFDTKANASLIARRTPLLEVNGEIGGVMQRKDSVKSESSGSVDCYLTDLYNQLKQLVNSKPGQKSPHFEDEAEDPRSQPMTWVSKWVDYSDKYGFGYSLNDDSIGVVFNDLTKLLLLADEQNIHYITYDGNEVSFTYNFLLTRYDNTNNFQHYYTMSEFPADVEKKVKLLNYFKNYMREHLLKAGANMEVD